MKFTDKLQELTGQIIDDPILTSRQQEERIIQAFDLCHFIHCYNSSLKVVDCLHHKINIVEDQDERKGIYFCDLMYNTQYYFDSTLYNPLKIESFRTQSEVTELWFVIVEEGFMTSDLSDSKEFVQRNNVPAIYDRIFHFNFTQSSVKILK
jgi:hypothetical protein